ncbi:hypothetical protein [Parasediminibacterium sp. JCM 36343]|uniref:hypothetical protein n=1 Tax=Parasediminibacterium sp. JCM 36343 TaxID=3374279 RepID=UPI00397B8D70
MRKKLRLIVYACSLLFVAQSHAQTNDDSPFKAYDNISIGIGAGIDYGGLGANVLYYPKKKLGFFAGAGYAIAGMGVNAGVKYRFLNETSSSRNVFYLMGMYGYNAAIKITTVGGQTIENSLYYGPSFGVGIERKRRAYKKGCWSFALLVPIRSQAFYEKYDYYKNLGTKFTYLPFSISVGYRFYLD